MSIQACYETYALRKLWVDMEDTSLGWGEGRSAKTSWMCLGGWDLPTDWMRVFRKHRGQNTKRILSLRGEWRRESQE